VAFSFKFSLQLTVAFLYVYLSLCVCMCVLAGGNHSVCVECSNGKKFYADVCLITISLGCLKQHAARLFNPPLPDAKAEAIENVAMGTVNKIILEFDGQVLPDGIFRLEMIWDYDNYDNEQIADRWHKKIGSFEAVADDVLMGKQAVSELSLYKLVTGVRLSCDVHMCYWGSLCVVTSVRTDPRSGPGLLRSNVASVRLWRLGPRTAFVLLFLFISCKPHFT